jgi:hypothetical protein
LEDEIEGEMKDERRGGMKGGTQDEMRAEILDGEEGAWNDGSFRAEGGEDHS